MRDSDIKYETAIALAKEKDTNGDLALKGMDLFVAQYFNLNYTESAGCEESITYIVDTFLECIDSVDFFTWITQGNSDGKPMVMSSSDFKTMFQEIADMNFTLQGIVDDVSVMYNQEWYVFGYESYDLFVATTTYQDDYQKINLMEIERAMAVFDTLMSTKAINGERRDIIIKRINEASNNLLKKYDGIDLASNQELFDFIDSKFGLGYCSGAYEEWDLSEMINNEKNE